MKTIEPSVGTPGRQMCKFTKPEFCAAELVLRVPSKSNQTFPELGVTNTQSTVVSLVVAL